MTIAAGAAARRRERVLAGLALVMLIAGWDATLRLDERVAPPRMRMSHAVEREIEPQAQEYVPVARRSLSRFAGQGS